MSFLPPRPAGWHKKKPLTKNQLRKLQEKYQNADKKAKEALKEEAADRPTEQQSVDEKVDGTVGWL